MSDLDPIFDCCNCCTEVVYGALLKNLVVGGLAAIVGSSRISIMISGRSSSGDSSDLLRLAIVSSWGTCFKGVVDSSRRLKSGERSGASPRVSICLGLRTYIQYFLT